MEQAKADSRETSFDRSGSSAERVSLIRRLVREGVERRRQAIVYELARSLLGRLRASEVAVGGADAGEQADWVRVESLSQLRATVGGRFQNLKKRWISAGFPLREHRGDREGSADIDETGWVELSLWIGKQGFEARLASESDPWLLEVRRVSSEDGGGS